MNKKIDLIFLFLIFLFLFLAFIFNDYLKKKFRKKIKYIYINLYLSLFFCIIIYFSYSEKINCNNIIISTEINPF